MITIEIVNGGAKLVQRAAYNWSMGDDATYGIAGCPGSPQEGPALLRVALLRYAERSSGGGP